MKLLYNKMNKNLVNSKIKFACLSLHNAEINIRKNFKLDDSFFVFTKCPFVIGDEWKDWLGLINYSRIEKSNLFLFLFKRNANGDFLNDDNKELREYLSLYFLSLFFINSFKYDSAFGITGLIEENNVKIQEVYQEQKYYYNEQIFFYNNEFTFKVKDFREAYKLTSKLKEIMKSKEFYRLRRGLNAYQKAYREYSQHYRLHQFVRAVEAILKPKKGKTKQQFIKRCKMLLNTNNINIDKKLGEIYDLRSNVEHLNDWTKDIKGELKENIALERAIAIELIARELYKYILNNSDILKFFKNDNTIDDFWNNKNKFEKFKKIKIVF